MKWKILIALDIAFSTIAVIAALVLGNSMLAPHVPKLHDNATWLSKLVVKGLITPDTLAKWALGSLPAMLTFLIFAFCVTSEWLLVVLSPLVVRLAAFIASDKLRVDYRFALQEIAGNHQLVTSLRRQLSRRVTLGLFGRSLVTFIIGASAGAIAWGVAALINANIRGLLQTIAIVIAIIVLLIVNELLGEILKEAINDDESIEMLRTRFTQADT